MSIRDCGPDCEDHYACRLRGKGIQVSPEATPSRHNRIPHQGNTPPSHWKNMMYDERPNGTKMPVMNPDGTPVRHRQMQSEAHRVDEFRRQRHANNPHLRSA